MLYRLEAACSTHTGCVRKRNEDNLCFSGISLDAEHADMDQPFCCRTRFFNNWSAAVFDGMGGENYGEVASFAAAGRMAASAESLPDWAPTMEQSLRTLVEDLNDAVLREQHQMQTYRMGTTMVSITFHRGAAYLCNLGDSRAYCLRSGDLIQLSKDHAAYRLAEPGRKPPLTQHLGIEPDDMIVEPHIAVQKYRRGDWYLLCSDGLSDMVPEEEITRILCSAGDPKACVETLISAGLEHGGCDNITVIALRIV